jgi:uncharacterized membrane protein YphA (DoxX/SURF4 family)
MFNFKKENLPSIHHIIRCGLGCVFIVAGFSKLFPLKDFLTQLLAYKLPLNDHFLYFCAVLLIAFEICVGVALLLNSHLNISLLGAQLLLLSMIPVTIWGNMQHAPTCGCYGNLIHRQPWHATIEDCVMFVITFLLRPIQRDSCDINRTVENWKLISIALITFASLVYGFWQLKNVFAFQAERLL